MRSIPRGRRTWAGIVTTVTATMMATVATVGAAGPVPAHHDDLSPEIRAIMDKPAYEHAQWGLLEVEGSTGRVVHSQYPDQFFIPGSTGKLVSVSSAWHALGGEHRFTTPVQALGRRTGSVLNGSLALVAQGDLTMGGRTKPDGSVAYTPIDHTYANDVPGATLTPENPLAGLDMIAQQVRRSGLTKVQGDVAIDSRIFSTASAPQLDPLPTPLIINDNVIDLLTTATTPGRPAQLSWRPQVAPYQVTSTVKTVAAGGTTNIVVNASPDGTRISLSGTIAAGAKPELRISPVQDPAAFGRTALIEALARAGVTVTAHPTGPNPSGLLPRSYAGTQRVAAYVSPIFAEYTKLIFKVSHNLGANLTICLMAVSTGSHACADGFGVINSFLRQAGIDPTQVQMLDGRGGNPNDRVTPRVEDEILHYWQGTEEAKRFREALPILGVDGSLTSVCEGSPTCPGKGKVWGKPGTFAGFDAVNQRATVGAWTLGGYLAAGHGKLNTFYIAMTGASAPDINGVLAIGNDVARIAGLLQQEAEARSHA
ncbi:D-alanyl-D-alanine carboxypeptidase/D-alanyl-D-alanine-endopeptidase [Streptomyces sp. RKAG293]|uniref:D-alanyl-D-alanine carboxypeptidase/D-alanyl-D-alanine endopeptidase n=1 Tax=Streptomyces sp. RKAG293 TaxID=2893403 RepID=UPI00203409C3|nr:D-alanyl-D-alanine carboxypeptidase/D-alanyl-D-alanine-endopeptidase [Streptomyces sp. RKAG293]MCM2420240.1 D-alanyl-D-alanine carboxypeptidase/D-alanyl-D-alanine-endopeptidase [Streptomyces sp. RKAG293]